MHVWKLKIASGVLYCSLSCSFKAGFLTKTGAQVFGLGWQLASCGMSVVA